MAKGLGARKPQGPAKAERRRCPRPAVTLPGCLCHGRRLRHFRAHIDEALWRCGRADWRTGGRTDRHAGRKKKRRKERKNKKWDVGRTAGASDARHDVVSDLQASSNNWLPCSCDPPDSDTGQWTSACQAASCEGNQVNILFCPDLPSCDLPPNSCSELGAITYHGLEACCWMVYELPGRVRQCLAGWLCRVESRSEYVLALNSVVCLLTPWVSSSRYAASLCH